MRDFAEFLRARIDTGGFAAEDALARFLPLARQTYEAHNLGLVAPLEGIADLHVDGVRVWFEEAKRRSHRGASPDVRRLQQVNRGVVDVVSEARITTDVDHGVQEITQHAIGEDEQPIRRPVYFPGY